MCVPERAAVCIRQFTYMQYFTATPVNAHCTYIWYCRNSCANSYTNSTKIMQTPENSSNTLKNYILANYKCLVTHCSGLWTGLCTKHYLHFFVPVNTHMKLIHEQLRCWVCWLQLKLHNWDNESATKDGQDAHRYRLYNGQLTHWRCYVKVTMDRRCRSLTLLL